MPLAASEKGAPKKAAPAKAAKPAKAPESIQIPAGAVETAPNTFAYTDSQGKKWIYRKTPFGVVRMDEKDYNAPPASVPEQKPVKVTAVERGDTVHFERPGPFGVYKWDRKKSELTDEERRWLEEAAKQD
jgi:hypothetical protein